MIWLWRLRLLVEEEWRGSSLRRRWGWGLIAFGIVGFIGGSIQQGGQQGPLDTLIGAVLFTCIGVYLVAAKPGEAPRTVALAALVVFLATGVMLGIGTYVLRHWHTVYTLEVRFLPSEGWEEMLSDLTDDDCWVSRRHAMRRPMAGVAEFRCSRVWVWRAEP
jgi:hypothetical protein